MENLRKNHIRQHFNSLERSIKRVMGVIPDPKHHTMGRKVELGKSIQKPEQPAMIHLIFDEIAK